MINRRICAIILAAAAAALCSCSSEVSDDTERAHTASTYPPEETVVFDTESTEADARVIAEQLCGLHDYELSCDGEGYAQGGEAMLYTAVSGDETYSLAVSYADGKYVYSDEVGDYIIDFQWLCEKYEIDQNEIESAVSSLWNEENPDSTNRIVATGTVLYGMVNEGEPAFEVWLMNDDGDAMQKTFAVSPDTLAVYAEGEDGFSEYVPTV